jgi:hypothetical protein
MPKRAASTSRYELQLSLLGRKNTMRPTVLLAFIVLYPLTTASFDIPISGMAPEVFLFRVVVGNLIIAPLLWVAGLQIDRLARTSIRVYLNLSMVFVLGAIRPLIMNQLEPLVFGTTTTTAGSLRPLLTGATSFGLFIIVAIFANLRLEFAEGSRAFSAIDAELDAYRNDSAKLLAEEEKRLGSVTRKRLEPVLRALGAQFEASKSTLDFKSALDELRDAIDNTVRPLTRYLAKVAAEPAKSLPTAAKQPRRVSALPSRASLKQSWQPRVQLLLAGPMFISLSAFEYGFGHIPQSLVMLLALWVVFELLRLLLPPRTLPALASLTISGIFGSSFWLLAFWITDMGATSLGLDSRFAGPLIFNIGSSTLLLSLIVSATYIFQYNLVELREALSTKKQELKRDKALFEQRIWVARRNYTYMVHGDVQSLLSVALTRARDAARPTKAELQLIRADLQKALELINAPLNKVSIDLERELEALVKTWAGACDITFEIDATVRELLLADSNLAFCVNELSKEIVGNAFRHGGSNELHFSIEASAETTVELIATSNGLPPAANPKPGVGLRMFDELSITWSMVPNKNNVGAKISLTLPL